MSQMIKLSRYGWTAEQVVAAAEAHGWIAPGALSAKTYARWLKVMGLSPHDLTAPGNYEGVNIRTSLKRQPHRRFRALHPNTLHQIDTTELARYFFDADTTGIGFEADMGPNRTGNGRPRIHLFCIIDDYSRCMYAEIRTRREAEDWISFCFSAWSPKSRNPLQGRPAVLYGDSDAATKATIWRHFAEDMDVEYCHHDPGNSAAKGKVERGAIAYLKAHMMRMLRPHLEAGRRLSLDDANALLSRIVDAKNARIHSTTGIPPAECWREHLAGPVRGMPPSHHLEMYFWIQAERVLLDDVSVQIDGVAYQLPREEPYISMVGHTLLMRLDRKKSRRRHLAVYIDREWRIIDAVQAMPDDGGEYRSLPTTSREIWLERAREADLGEDFDPLQVYAPPEGTMHPLPPTTPFGDTDTSDAQITRIDGKLVARDRGITLSDEDIARIFGDQDSIPVADFENAVHRLA